MFARIRSGWDLTKKSWGVVRSHPGLARLPLTGGAVALIFFLLLCLPGAVIMGSEVPGKTVAGLALVTVGAYLASFSVIYFNVALAAGADQALRGDVPDIGAAKRVARSRAGNIAGWTLVSVVVWMVLGVLSGRGGIGGASGLITWIGVILGVIGVVLYTIGGTVPMVTGALITLLGVTIAIGGAVFGGATRGVFGVALYRHVADGSVAGPFTAAELEAVASSK